MIIIYHNNRCGKSREALKLLESSGKPFRSVEYLKDVPSIQTLQTLLQKLKLKPFEIIRTKESVFQEKYKGKTLSDAEWLLVLHENPILLERPIVVNGSHAVVARPPEKLLDII